MKCEHCGIMNSDWATFCNGCGRPLKQDPLLINVAPTQAQPAFVMASFWQRAGAIIIDNFMLGLVSYCLIFTIIIPWLVVTDSGNPSKSDPAALIGMWLTMFVVQTIMHWLYFSLFESSEKQATLGKMACRLKVADINGKRISFWRASGRYFASILSSLFFFIGYIMFFFTAWKQTFHDKVTDTYVLEV